MIEILKDYDLSKLNTFGVHAKALFFTEIKNEADMIELFSSQIFKDNDVLFLGGGSNILFIKDFDGIVVLNKLKGIEQVEENDEYVLLKIMSGEVWHDLVLYAVRHNYWGIENLSLIPGSVGATPVQNIGAYGVEIKDVLVNVCAIEIESGKVRVFENSECEFGYRESIFKNKLKGKYFIQSVTLKLSKKENKNIKYRVLQNFLVENNIEVNGVGDISKAIIDIRMSKLPDPKVLGNAGSFFKNVYVDEIKLLELLKNYPEMPYFKEADLFKIPTAWLVETSGWKGKREGNVGVHEKQALVLVNYGGATGQELKNLAQAIIDSVYLKFGIKITPEVNLI